MPDKAINLNEYGVWRVWTHDKTKAYNGEPNDTSDLGFYRGKPKDIAKYVKQVFSREGLPWQAIHFAPVTIRTLTGLPAPVTMVREDTDGAATRKPTEVPV